VILKVRREPATRLGTCLDQLLGLRGSHEVMEPGEVCVSGAERTIGSDFARNG